MSAEKTQRLSVGWSVLSLVGLIVIMTQPGIAQPKPVSLYLNGGLTLPTSNKLELGWKTGWHGEAGIGMSFRERTEIVLRVSIHTLNSNKVDLLIADGARFTALMYGGDLKLNLGAPFLPVAPYLLGGLGMATLEVSDYTPLPNATPNIPLGDPRTRFYFSLGAGLEIGKYVVQARFVHTRARGESYSYVPLSFGIKL